MKNFTAGYHFGVGKLEPVLTGDNSFYLSSKHSFIHSALTNFVDQ